MKLFKILFLFVCISGFAQNKTGTVDVEFILSKMPEITAVQDGVNTYGKALDADLATKMKAYTDLIDTYKAGEASFTEPMKQTKQEEILAMEDDIKKFQQNAIKLAGIKRDELLRPLYTKIGASLEKIAKADNYSQIFQLNNQVVYFDDAYDLTLKVVADMGIVLKEE